MHALERPNSFSYCIPAWCSTNTHPRNTALSATNQSPSLLSHPTNELQNPVRLISHSELPGSPGTTRREPALSATNQLPLLLPSPTASRTRTGLNQLPLGPWCDSDGIKCNEPVVLAVTPSPPRRGARTETRPNQPTPVHWCNHNLRFHSHTGTDTLVELTGEPSVSSGDSGAIRCLSPSSSCSAANMNAHCEATERYSPSSDRIVTVHYIQTEAPGGRNRRITPRHCLITTPLNATMCLTIHHLLCCCYCAAWPPDTIITNPTCSDEHANAGPKHAAHNARLPPTITHALPPALSPLPSSFPIIIRSTAERSHPQSAPATTLACILLNDESTPSMRNHTRTQITISYAPRHPPLLLQTDAQYKALIPTAASSSNATPAQLPLIPTPHLTTRSVCQPPHALAAFTTICTPENVQNPQGASKGSANAQNHTLHIVLAPDSSLPFYPMSGRCVMPPTEIPTRVGTPNASKTENAQRPPNEAESTLSVLANLPASQIVLPPTIASVFTPTCAPAPTKNTQSTPDAPTNVQNALLHVLPLPDFLVPFYRYAPYRDSSTRHALRPKNRKRPTPPK